MEVDDSMDKAGIDEYGVLNTVLESTKQIFSGEDYEKFYDKYIQYFNKGLEDFWYDISLILLFRELFSSDSDEVSDMRGYIKIARGRPDHGTDMIVDTILSLAEGEPDPPQNKELFLEVIDMILAKK